ncbi:hypothetical protein TorRG33x02_011090 [Trema orientale]|uniref:Uncharacterized protein n=1 Tax=Trema orientale TaxID=63057 RepID=A0A2P5FZ27_TREOI|nr:hypothetical protein TorRG33x02_011090 [Trema orientale]
MVSLFMSIPCNVCGLSDSENLVFLISRLADNSHRSLSPFLSSSSGKSRSRFGVMDRIRLLVLKLISLNPDVR